MAKRFIKSNDGVVLARLLGFNPTPAKKPVWDCCEFCDGVPLLVEEGWEIDSLGLSPMELKKNGLLTSRNY